jgi:YD repeat-containing protein
MPQVLFGAHKTEVEFKFGLMDVIEYRISDMLDWGKERKGGVRFPKVPPADGNYAGECYAVCPVCDKDYWVDITVSDNVIAAGWTRSPTSTGRGTRLAAEPRTRSLRATERRSFPGPTATARAAPPNSVHDALAGSRTTFELDALGRVTAVQAPAGAQTHAYDAAGNHSTAHWTTDDGDAVGAREYTGSLLTQAGRTRYAYDDAGRVILRQRSRLSKKPGAWHYTWNAEDQLIQTVTPDGTVWRYEYDPFGRRTAKERLTEEGTVAERTDFTWHRFTLVLPQSLQLRPQPAHVDRPPRTVRPSRGRSLPRRLAGASRLRRRAEQ